MSSEIYTSNTHYSADVLMYIQYQNRRIELAGCLGNQCTLRSSVQIPPCVAELVILIDGEEFRKRIRLPKGISIVSLIAEFEIIESKLSRFAEYLRRKFGPFMPSISKCRA